MSTAPAIALRRVLIVDDEENIRLMLSAVLRREGHEVTLAPSAGEALAALENKTFDVLISDVRMPGMSGLELLDIVLPRYPHLVVIIMSAYGNLDTTIEAIKRGAYDYLPKPFKPDEVVLVLRKAEERERLKQENQRLRSDLERMKEASGLGRMIARSASMHEVFKRIRKIAEYKTTVLIQGESGTGKELVARAVHDHSTRATQPFVAVNCGAIPENLLESELFGHVKGAFTDASRDKKGLFAEADGGTLFLDEIGELPLNLQVKLLRALQEEEIRRVGDNRDIRIDVRVIAATVRDLAADAKDNLFREDLFYRLNVVSVRLPPLRERVEDLPPLCSHFVERFNERLGRRIEGFEPEALAALRRHHWPGNVRELENLVERCVLFADGPRIGLPDLPETVRGAAPASPDPAQNDPLALKSQVRAAAERVERDLIDRALKVTDHNVTRAAKLLHISRKSLQVKMRDLGLRES